MVQLNRKGYLTSFLTISILVMIIVVFFGITYYLNIQKTILVSEIGFNKFQINISRGEFIILKNIEDIDYKVIIGENQIVIPAKTSIRSSFLNKGQFKYFLDLNKAYNGTIVVE